MLRAQVDFDGQYPIEGAKEVGTLITRYVSRALRAWGGGSTGALAPAAASAKINPLKEVGSKLQGLLQLQRKKQPREEGIVSCRSALL